MLGGGPVCLYEASKQAVWISKFMKELSVSDEIMDDDDMVVFTDNQSALAIAKGTDSAKTKHIDVAYHYVRYCLQKKLTDIKYIPTTMMLADILTKPLPNSKARPLHQKIFSLQ